MALICTGLPHTFKHQIYVEENKLFYAKNVQISVQNCFKRAEVLDKIDVPEKALNSPLWVNLQTDRCSKLMKTD